MAFSKSEKRGMTRTKEKYRKVYSDSQRILLEREFFFQNKYLTSQTKSALAKSLGLSERQVKIWFQNRRAKERKQIKKQHEETQVMQTKRLAKNFANKFSGLRHALEDPQLVNNPLPPGSGLNKRHIPPQRSSVNVTPSGGLITPPSTREDVQLNPSSYSDADRLASCLKENNEGHVSSGSQ